MREVNNRLSGLSIFDCPRQYSLTFIRNEHWSLFNQVCWVFLVALQYCLTINGNVRYSIMCFLQLSKMILKPCETKVCYGMFNYLIAMSILYKYIILLNGSLGIWYMAATKSRQAQINVPLDRNGRNTLCQFWQIEAKIRHLGNQKCKLIFNVWRSKTWNAIFKSTFFPIQTREMQFEN